MVDEAQAGLTRPADSDRPRVLCVDDDPDLVRSLYLVLRKHFRVVGATSGQQALALVAAATAERGEGFDAVLSDLRMPGLSGAELLLLLRQQHPAVARILLSGRKDLPETDETLAEAAVHRVLVKPCPTEVLLDCLADVIDHSRRQPADRLSDGPPR